MLDPDYLDRAGDMVAGVYGEIEADMLAYLCRLLLDQDIEGLGQRGVTAVNLLAQSAAPQLMAFIESHRDEVNEAVRRTVEDAMSRSDAADAAAISGAAPGTAVAASRTLPRQVELTARGIAAILERDNVDMAQGALDLWNRCVAEAVTKVNTGAETADTAVHQAVRRMMREGVSTVTYRDPTTGRQTVTNRIDVAVRRHVRTQLAQDGMRRTLDVCADAGVRLVEVSSHGGARPSHARWQGRVYSLNGEVEVDGVRYKDFYSETGYGKVDGLGGANCRHSFGPWVPGAPRMYSPDPEHPSGLPSDEVYRLTQEQRRRERDIRQTKRELAGAQLIADKDASLANIAEVERLKDKLRRQQAGLREHIDKANKLGKADVLQRAPNREWAGDMPRIRKTDSSRRTMKEFMNGDGVKRALKARGISRSAAQKALSAELRSRGIDPRNWQNLSKANQQGIFKRAIAGLRGTKKAGAKSATKAPATAAKIMEGKGVSGQSASAIASIADGCQNADVRRAFSSSLADLRLDSTTAARGQAYYSPRTQGITLNMDDTARGFAARPDKAPYQTFFHEYGHYIDHRNGQGARYASEAAGLGVTAKKEVQTMLREIKKREGYGSVREAKEHLTREVITLYRSTPELIGGLSDIIHGATSGTCCDYALPAHRKSYWKGKWGAQALATETFAHFFECSTANPQALETLKRYLPKTYDVFTDMMKGF
ncbi:phage minor capsid protein [Olsenella sp. An188]|uniref:phage minor capsid protein n=1 Tax=Olsenella sp. An188 TaxID=1965579 RepID=UPI000B367459|nr:phage minor capsid protein [Olsenella sp. An188]OUP37956.1 hypothetical protein B5F23_08345 [Olsenella sp. An188]